MNPQTVPVLIPLPVPEFNRRAFWALPGSILFTPVLAALLGGSFLPISLFLALDPILAEFMLIAVAPPIAVIVKNRKFYRHLQLSDAALYRLLVFSGAVALTTVWIRGQAAATSYFFNSGGKYIRNSNSNAIWDFLNTPVSLMLFLLVFATALLAWIMLLIAIIDDVKAAKKQAVQYLPAKYAAAKLSPRPKERFAGLQQMLTSSQPHPGVVPSATPASLPSVPGKQPSITSRAEIVARPNSALLVVDAQLGVFQQAFRRSEVVEEISQLVVAARKAHIPIFWVHNSDASLPLGSPEWQLVPELSSLPGEAQVHKLHRDAFAGTDLNESLTAANVGQVVVVGGFTDACVSATLHGAFSRGYNVTLVADAHSTKDRSESGLPSAESLISQANFFWSTQTAPNQNARVVSASELQAEWKALSDARFAPETAA